MAANKRAATKSKPKATGEVKILTHKLEVDNWPGAFAVYWQVLRQFCRNPGPAVLFVGLFALFSLFSSALQGWKSYGASGYHDYEDVLQLALLLALPVYGLALADGRHISISRATALDWRKYIGLFVATILYVIVGIGSLLFLIVPIIWAVGWFSLYLYPITEEGVGIIAAFKESKRLSRQYIGHIWALAGVSVLCALPVFLLMFIPYVVGPAYLMFVAVLSYGATAKLYRYLQQVVRE